MAGIGFELRKLFSGKGLFPGIKACLYSMLLTVGPTLLCMFMLITLQKLMQVWGIEYSKRELFMAAVIYAFIFSLIISSLFTMTLSRFISDKIYTKEEYYILPSLRGATIICMVIGGVLGFLFYAYSPLPISFKLAAYILFMELVLLWLQMVYVSALRSYLKLVYGFFFRKCQFCPISFYMHQSTRFRRVYWGSNWSRYWVFYCASIF